MDNPYEIFTIDEGYSIWIGTAKDVEEAIQKVGQHAGSKIGVRYVAFCLESGEKIHFKTNANMRISIF